MAKVAVAVAASESRCGLSPQKIPAKSGPAAKMDVASRMPNIVVTRSMVPSSHGGRLPPTAPLDARTGLGTPTYILAVGGSRMLSTLASISRGLPSTHKIMMDLRDMTARFGGWNVKKIWCQTPAANGDAGKKVGSLR